MTNSIEGKSNVVLHGGACGWEVCIVKESGDCLTVGFFRNRKQARQVVKTLKTAFKEIGVM